MKLDRICLLLSLLIFIIFVSGCNGKVTVIDKGTITEVKDVVTTGLEGVKEVAESIVYNIWSEQKISIPKKGYQIIYSDYNVAVQGYSKKIICNFKSEESVSIYAIRLGELNKAINGQDFDMYPSCSSRNSLVFKCTQSCIVPLDVIYFIKNENSDSDAIVEINLKYMIINTTS